MLGLRSFLAAWLVQAVCTSVLAVEAQISCVAGGSSFLLATFTVAVAPGTKCTDGAIAAINATVPVQAASVQANNVYAGATSNTTTELSTETSSTGSSSSSNSSASSTGTGTASHVSAGTAAPSSTCPAIKTTTGQKRHVAYYEVYDAADDTKPFQADYLTGVTHVIKAFVDMTTTPFVWQTSGTFAFPPDSDLTAKGAKIMGAFGGWNLQAPFDAASASPEAMATFANNIADFVAANGLAGVDLDYEYPGGGGGTQPGTIADATTTWPQLVATIRNAIGCDKILSVAVPAPAMEAWTNAGVIAAIDPIIDFWNIMSYDLVNRNSPATGPHTSVQGSTAAIEQYKGSGVDVSKMNIGFPMYAKVFPATSCSATEPVGCPMPSMNAVSDVDSDAFRFQTDDNGNWGTPAHTATWWSNAIASLQSIVLGPTEASTTATASYNATAMSDMVYDSTLGQFWTWPSPYSTGKLCSSLISTYPTVSIMSFGIGMDSEPAIPHYKALQACFGSTS